MALNLRNLVEEARQECWLKQYVFSSVWLPGVGRNFSTTAWMTGHLANAEEEMERQ